ncbi:MAG: lactonase family protein, partial [Planctomycetes bacterium]|nr:lactonase family protein [Planctomycetota bacterium]
MTSRLTRTVFLHLLGILMTISARSSDAQDLLVFVSAFAPGNEGAIQAYSLNPKSRDIKLLRKNSGVEHPFFLAVSRDNRFLYSIYAPGQFGGKDPEQVAAFELVGRTGELKPLNRQSAKGTAACYLDVDSTGRSLLVANYSTGNLASFPVETDGSLKPSASFFQHTGSSVDASRQMEPHAHCIVISPDNRFAFVADLGLDQIRIYQLDATTAKLLPHAQSFVRTPPGAGPRHLTFHPNGKHVYVINELKSSITVFDYDASSGSLFERQTISTLPPDFKGVSHCADVKVTPNGRYVYGTNRGHDSIACYRVNSQGQLDLIEIIPSLGKGPQNLAITPGGELLLCANMPGNNVATFEIDNSTGKINSTGKP